MFFLYSLFEIHIRNFITSQLRSFTASQLHSFTTSHKMSPRIIKVSSQEEEQNNLFGDVEEYGDHHWVDQELAVQDAEQDDEENMDWLPEEEELAWAPPAAVDELDDEFDALLDNVVQLWPGFDEDDDQNPGLPVIVGPNPVADDEGDDWVEDVNMDYDAAWGNGLVHAGDLEDEDDEDDEWIPENDGLDDDDDDMVPFLVQYLVQYDDDEWVLDEDGDYILQNQAPANDQAPPNDQAPVDNPDIVEDEIMPA